MASVLKDPFKGRLFPITDFSAKQIVLLTSYQLQTANLS